MKLPRTLLIALTLAACSDVTAVREPTSPGSPPAAPPTSNSDDRPAWIWAMVVTESGVCIPGAKVEVVKGQALGQSLTQDEPCDAWGYGGGVMFTHLKPGVEMVLRASAPGFVPEEKTIYPSAGPQTAVIFGPEPEHR